MVSIFSHRYVLGADCIGYNENNSKGITVRAKKKNRMEGNEKVMNEIGIDWKRALRVKMNHVQWDVDGGQGKSGIGI